MKIALILLTIGISLSCIGLILFFNHGGFSAEIYDVQGWVFLFFGILFAFSGILLLIPESKNPNTL